MYRKLAVALLVTLSACTSIPTEPPRVRVDLKVNNQDDRVVVEGTPFIFSWTSANTTACQIVSPSGTSGIDLSGVSVPININHPWYPGKGDQIKLMLSCTNGKNSASDIVTITRK